MKMLALFILTLGLSIPSVALGRQPCPNECPSECNSSQPSKHQCVGNGTVCKWKNCGRELIYTDAQLKLMIAPGKCGVSYYYSFEAKTCIDVRAK